MVQPGGQVVDQWPRPLGADGSALVRRQAGDVALDGEQGVDAGHRLDGDGRLLQLRQLIEFAPAMRPARRLDDGAFVVQPIEARKSVGLHDAGETAEQGLGMLAAAIG